MPRMHHHTMPVTEAAPHPSPYPRHYAMDTDVGVDKPDQGYLLKLALLALFSWSLLGKKCMMTMAVWMGLPTRMLTIPSHAITVGLSLASILLVISAGRAGRALLHWSMVPFAIFWACYSFQLYTEFLAVGMVGAPPTDATFSASYVAQRALGSCLLPALAILINLHWGFHRQNRILCLAMALATAATFLAMFQENILHFEKRMQPGEETGDFTTISSLQMGYTGLGLFTFVAFEFFGDHRKSLLRLLVTLAGAGVSLLLIVGSASRGPMVALACMFVPLAASLYARGRRAKFLQVVIGCAVIGAAVIGIAEATGSSVFDRLMGLQQDIQQRSAQSDRLVFYRLALDAFAEAPLFGAQTTLWGSAYPHNLFIESLMATGLVGTIPLCIVIVYSFVCSWRLLVRWPHLGWISLNYYIYFVGALFSGAIFTNSAFWVCLAATIGAARWAEAEEAADEPAEEPVDEPFIRAAS